HGDSEARSEDGDVHRGDAETRSEERDVGAQPPSAAVDDASFNPEQLGENIAFDFGANADDDTDASQEIAPDSVQDDAAPAIERCRSPRGGATVPEVLKYLTDRTGYIKELEEEATPDSFARIENLRELVNAAMDSRDRGETLAEFLDHAALVSDVDTYDPRG